MTTLYENYFNELKKKEYPNVHLNYCFSGRAYTIATSNGIFRDKNFCNSSLIIQDEKNIDGIRINSLRRMALLSMKSMHYR